VKLIVKLDVSDFELFEKYERTVNPIIERHGGVIIEAFEIERNDNSGQEIHILEFPDELSFERYKNDADLNQHQDLRKKAILGTEVNVVGKSKNYG